VIDIPPDVRERSTTALFLWLTTVTAQGQPQSSPVWFLWDDVDGFLIYSQPGAAKVRNLRVNPRVSLSFPTDGSASTYATIEGVAELLDGPPSDRVPAYLEKYEALIAGEGWTIEWLAGEYSQPIRVVPTRVRSA
jgi:PPOX class probable F420-dependent enzyme